jgi:nucleoside-diphosphate-sugar epimerase
VSRALVTGGAGTVGAAVVRRLLGDPDFEIRVSDERRAPDWMREGAGVHAGDLRDPGEAARAVRGCTHVIHLAAAAGPFTQAEVDVVLLRAACDAGVERFTCASPGEFACSAAHDELGLPFTICRLFGLGTCAPTHPDDLADGVVTATAHPAGLNEDFDIATSEELPAEEIARLADVRRPATEKAERLLGWRARHGVREGIEAWLAAR